MLGFILCLIHAFHWSSSNLRSLRSEEKQKRKWKIFFNGRNDNNHGVYAEEITASIIILNRMWFVPKRGKVPQRILWMSRTKGERVRLSKSESQSEKFVICDLCVCVCALSFPPSELKNAQCLWLLMSLPIFRKNNCNVVNERQVLFHYSIFCDREKRK